MSDYILVKLQLEINCPEILEPNVVLRLGNSVHLPSVYRLYKQIYCMKQNTLARLGTTWLLLNNWSILNKSDVLSFSLYLFHSKVLSNHIFVGIHQITICCEIHKLNVVLIFCVLAFSITVCMKQNTSAGLGTIWLQLNNLSVLIKFDVLLISLYFSDAIVFFVVFF